MRKNLNGIIQFQKKFFKTIAIFIKMVYNINIKYLKKYLKNFLECSITHYFEPTTRFRELKRLLAIPGLSLICSWKHDLSGR